jgi:hypothetical protein
MFFSSIVLIVKWISDINATSILCRLRKFSNFSLCFNSPLTFQRAKHVDSHVSLVDFINDSAQHV